MASRPVFVPTSSGDALVETRVIDFPWVAGLAASQKALRIEALHASAARELGISNILEVSTKSSSPLGVSLSAFNLMIETRKLKQVFSVESAYQSSKVFQSGGPFLDLLQVDSHTAKVDPRLRDSGNLIGFRFFGVEWSIEPITAFYDWLYISALYKHNHLTDLLEEYSAFTDIEFNPSRSVNCQAYSVAIFCSLRSRGLLDEALTSKEKFLEVVYQREINNSRQNQSTQPELQFSEVRDIID
jgi:hypothetical protein